ncbi:hypothetical protein QUC32_04505 [Novosphingobium resinovorum]|uniref:hypothetical protein n=1 Tax=Sphingomonadaceae TaxID=41297 RepID=UPI00027CA72A|nr:MULTISPECIES: hypothetical protein [Sphingomonadaceae]EJU12807.1 hypothetical protein LH128_11963 [Sphingomonas sp. LH128]MBF7014071.1 hypothetical protein [Novosphingobium sp. HR1a]WJM26215.1 hypothetical protein QUC32_04505 [Novosphingobium resinovorum]
MLAHTRSMIAAIAFAVLTGKKVAGLYDHSLGRDLQIAAEFRDGRLQGFDGARSVKFGGTLPEIHDAGDKNFVSVEIDGAQVKGYDRASSTFFAARVEDGLVQVYDYGQKAWFVYDVQDPQAASEYHRAAGPA